MAVFAVDTSCMIAAVCTWHEHHAAAAGEIERRLGRRERMAIPAPALVDACTTLTRLPAPHRLAPADVFLTFNIRQFDPPPKGVRVVEPAASG